MRVAHLLFICWNYVIYFVFKVYLVRCGESEFNEQNLIGGDSSLSERGKKFASALSEYFAHLFAPGGAEAGQNAVRNIECNGNGQGGERRKDQELSSERNVLVWTSPMRRARETGEVLKVTRALVITFHCT